jgi:hypothetical protein
MGEIEQRLARLGLQLSPPPEPPPGLDSPSPGCGSPATARSC